MKNAVKKLWDHIEGINGLILILYCIFIFSSFAFFELDLTEHLIKWLLLIVAVSVLFCPLLIKAVGKIRFPNRLNTRSGDKLWDVLFFLIPFVLFLIKYLIYYPMGLSPDTYDQLTDALTNQYHDWHPALHTLLAFKLPLLLTGGWFGSVTLFQILVFSVVLWYSLRSIKAYTGTGYAVAAMLFIMLNPQTTNMAMYPWKDVAFAIGALLMLTYVLHIYFTDGQWIKNPINTCLLIVVFVLTTFFRHNAVLFTVPLLIAVFILIAKKRALVICLCAATLFCGIKYPLYSALGVESPDQRQVETLGLPMTVIGAVVTYAPEQLDEETLTFAYRVAPAEVWEEKFTYGNYNYVKWDDRTNNYVIEEYGAAKVLGMAVRCFKQCPTVALKSLIRLTEVVYSVCGNYIYLDMPSVGENPYGISDQGIPALQNLNEKISPMVFACFPGLFMYIGAMHLALIVSFLAKFQLNKRKAWKVLLILLPVFVYNFGTALLLTGANDSSRFFYYTFFLMPTLLVFLFKSKVERGTTA